jgi:hypothetical protein
LKDVSIEDCVDVCKQTHGECSAGYYIHKTDSNPSICVPIKTDVNPMINPLDILTSKNNFPDLKGINTSVFWNVKVFPLNSDYMKNVIFRTVSSLKNKETSLFIKASSGKEEPIVLTESESDSDIVIVHPSFYMISTDLYKPVMYNSSIMISTLNTSLKMIQDNDILQWKILDSIGYREDSYKFISTSVSKQSNIHYGDEFYISSSSGKIVIIQDKQLKLSNQSIDVLKSLNIPYIFSFSSRETGYYCDDSGCHHVSGKDIFSVDKKKIVTHNIDCNNLCGDSKSSVNIANKPSNIKTVFIIGLILVFLIWLIWLIWLLIKLL